MAAHDALAQTDVVDGRGRRTRLRVAGMDCASCATKIDTALRRLPTVRDVRVAVPTGRVTVDHGEALAPDALARQVEALGYRAVVDAGLPSAARAESTAGVPASTVQAPAANGHDHSGHGHADQREACEGHDGHDHGHAPLASAARGGTPAPRDSHGALPHDHGSIDGPWWRNPRVQLTAACGLALAAAFAVGRLRPDLENGAFLVAMLIGLVPIARRAFAAARLGTPFSIETLMTIAAVGAVFIGATEEAAAVVFLFLVGELLEGVAAGRARRSIQALTELVPRTALLEREDGATVEVPAASLAVGGVILVRPGDRVPADGEIVNGEGSIDEAPVTGESTPKRKGLGDALYAGTINTDGVLRVRVTATAEDNTIARVVRLVEEAQESKAPTERFIDRFSSYYTPAVLAVAALVAVVPPLLFGGSWSEWIYKGLAILLIGCPCALVISTPAAIAAGLSAGARRGLLLKGGAVLEAVGGITRVAFDKTGTLTEGKPVVTDVVGFRRGETEVLTLAAALEAGSSHPLAKAILARAAREGVVAPVAAEASVVAGKGVAGRVGEETLFLASPVAAAERVPLSADHASRIEALNAEGKTVSVLLANGAVIGLLAMRDEPRADAKAGVTALRAAGIRTLMLTGDNRRTAAAIGEDLGLEVRAELLPEDKQRMVRELQAIGERVAKVGDGINDAPGLAAADVGIAMGGGTDVALETADAAILHGRVLDVADMIGLSRRVMANIKQNIVVSLGLKAVFLVTTVLGVTGLWPAILADTGATVLVTANALRLLGTFRNGKSGHLLGQADA